MEQCQQAGLVWGRELYIDATKVEANASLDSLTPRFAVEAHLANVFAEEAAQAEQHMTQEEEASREPGEQAEVEVPMQLPVALSQEDRQALCQRNQERYDWLEHLGAQDRSVSIPWYQRVADLQVSTTRMHR